MNKYKLVTVFLIFSAILASCMVILASCMVRYTYNEAKKPSITLLSEEIEETSYSSLFRVRNINTDYVMTIDLMEFKGGCNCSPTWVDTTEMLTYNSVGEYYYIEFIDLKEDTAYNVIFEFENITRERTIAYHVSHFRTKESLIGECKVDTRMESVTISLHDFIADGADVMGLNVTPVAFKSGVVQRIYLSYMYNDDIRLWVNENVHYEDTHLVVPISFIGENIPPCRSTRFYFLESMDKTPFVTIKEGEWTYFIVIEPHTKAVLSFEGDIILKRYYKITVIESFMYDPETTVFLTTSEIEKNTVTFVVTLDENATFIEEDDC